MSENSRLVVARLRVARTPKQYASIKRFAEGIDRVEQLGLVDHFIDAARRIGGCS